MSEATTIDDVDYGPLAVLVGTWTGDKGVDKAPEPDGEERSLFYETIIFEAIGYVDNAEKQTLTMLRYHQVVSRKSNDEVFHNETGYWMWDKADGTIMQSFSIPRGVAVLAGGNCPAPADITSELTLRVAAKAGDLTFGVLQSPFMQANAKTTGFSHDIIVQGANMRYSETTFLDIYGKDYDHTDINRLQRVK
jgi:hypothetical protein